MENLDVFDIGSSSDSASLKIIYTKDGFPDPDYMTHPPPEREKPFLLRCQHCDTVGTTNIKLRSCLYYYAVSCFCCFFLCCLWPFFFYIGFFDMYKDAHHKCSNCHHTIGIVHGQKWNYIKSVATAKPKSQKKISNPPKSILKKSSKGGSSAMVIDNTASATNTDSPNIQNLAVNSRLLIDKDNMHQNKNGQISSAKDLSGQDRSTPNSKFYNLANGGEKPAYGFGQFKEQDKIPSNCSQASECDDESKKEPKKKLRFKLAGTKKK